MKKRYPLLLMMGISAALLGYKGLKRLGRKRDPFLWPWQDTREGRINAIWRQATHHLPDPHDPRLRN